jgi:hypothetical protein
VLDIFGQDNKARETNKGNITRKGRSQNIYWQMMDTVIKNPKTAPEDSDLINTLSNL